jgi:hypothetical protein
VAVDGAGDVFVADDGDDPLNSRVEELPAGGWAPMTLPFSGLNVPSGVAVDRSGDVFVADVGSNQVVELPAGGSQVTLPFSGLNTPNGVAVDGGGDVFVADGRNNRVVELTPSVPSGSLTSAPGSGPAGSQIGVSSVTPCPLNGGAFGSAEAKVKLTSSAGATVANATASLDSSGNWSATLTVPNSAANGAVYFVGASCLAPTGLVTQNYASAPFTVTAPTPGAHGATGPAGPSPTRSNSTCTTTKHRSTTLCTITYTFATPVSASVRRAVAISTVHGRRQILGRGTVRRYTVKLTFSHLRPGRYQLELYELVGHRRVLIGDTTLSIS